MLSSEDVLMMLAAQKLAYTQLRIAQEQRAASDAATLATNAAVAAAPILLVLERAKKETADAQWLLKIENRGLSEILSEI
jgi:hypothetical protein